MADTPSVAVVSVFRRRMPGRGPVRSTRRPRRGPRPRSGSPTRTRGGCSSGRRARAAGRPESLPPEWPRLASRFQRDPLPVLGRDGAVNVEIGAAVGAEVDVVDAPERPLELRSADRALEMEVETRTLGWWRRT